jgi:Tfp pilus assembly protein PilF
VSAGTRALADSTPEQQAELGLADATLLFSNRDYAGALKELNAILAHSPGLKEVLELKALTQKMKGETAEALATYRDLIASQAKKGATPADLAPYHYEAGSIEYQQGKLAQARKDFELALESKFNLGATHLFLGLIALASHEPLEAEDHFRATLSSDAQDLKGPASLYLGQAYSAQDYPSGAVRSFQDAEDKAEKRLSDPATPPEAREFNHQIQEAATKALSAFDHKGVFGSASLLGGYDTNASLQPGSSTQGASGIATPRIQLSGALGYATSPLSSFQFVPVYHGSVNFDTNTAARPFEFATNDLALYVTHEPYARLSYGLKLEAQAVFKNNVDPVTDPSGTFDLYETFPAVGPYAKWELWPRIVLGAEAYFQFDRYYDDKYVPQNEKRTGPEYLGRLSADYEPGLWYLHPSLVLGYDYQNTTGTDFRTSSPSVELDNELKFSRQAMLLASLAYSFWGFTDRRPDKRYDRKLEAGGTFSYRLSKRWGALADVHYIHNASTIPDYAYDDLVALGGVDFAF